MQLALGRKGDYSVRAVLDLARHYREGRRKAREIAASMDIPEQYLPQVLAPLVRAGFLSALAGPDGGYRLAVDPADITLLQVIEAAEGPLASNHCVLRGGPCDWDNVCPLHDAWSEARQALARRLDRVTFEELAVRDEEIEHGRAPESAFPLHPERVPRRGIRGASPSSSGPTTNSEPLAAPPMQLRPGSSAARSPRRSSRRRRSR